MSDSMYELEDIIWDDFDRGDDHIVPHSTNSRINRNLFEGDSCKKPKREETSVLINAENLRISERDSKSLDKKKNMMEKESSSSHGVFKNSYATSAAGYDNSYSCPVTQISQSEDLYYGWPDIGNFEDVDKMLRSCDSSFGLGDDELGWMQIGGGNEEALKMDFKLSCHEPSGLNLNNILPDHASTQAHLMESCGDLSFEGNGSEQKQGFEPVFVGSQNDIGVHQKEMGSLNVPESSSISSELDEISLEATSFRQLQQVMEQLDMRTKLCIRDSLYRLARSAEQRHINLNPSLSRSVTDISDMAERSNNGLMEDMETDTNPIDRSVAHLLFHRPSESHNLKHGSMAEKHDACEEELNGK